MLGCSILAAVAAVVVAVLAVACTSPMCNPSPLFLANSTASSRRSAANSQCYRALLDVHVICHLLGGVRTGGYPKTAPVSGPLGFQRPSDWDLLWSPARSALKAVPTLKAGQLVSAVPGLYSLTKKVRPAAKFAGAAMAEAQLSSSYSATDLHAPLKAQATALPWWSTCVVLADRSMLAPCNPVCLSTGGIAHFARLLTCLCSAA